MSRSKPWYLNHPVRLRQEQEAIASRFPDFTLMRGDDGALGWVGFLTSNRGNQYKVLIDYRDEFPHEEPYAYILQPRFESQHIWGDGHLCLMYPGGSTWRTNTTAASLLAIVAAWIFSYETHKEKCRRDHGKPCIDPKCPHWPGDTR